MSVEYRPITLVVPDHLYPHVATLEECSSYLVYADGTLELHRRPRMWVRISNEQRERQVSPRRPRIFQFDDWVDVSFLDQELAQDCQCSAPYRDLEGDAAVTYAKDHLWNMWFDWSKRFAGLTCPISGQLWLLEYPPLRKMQSPPKLQVIDPDLWSDLSPQGE
ncbi:MAG: hypothetical protein ACREP9_10500 [Candidatus Dormibacteraceae bacterium]